MSQWKYNDTNLDLKAINYATAIGKCWYCNCKMEHGILFNNLDEHYHKKKTAKYCTVCGWWTVREEEFEVDQPPKYEQRFGVISGAVASLRNLDLPLIDLPLSEVRTHLIRKYEDRFDIGWDVFEDVVASVFKDMGYLGRVTARSADGGIDVILDGPNGNTIGVQVKRYRKKIEAEQIRSLAGALIVNNHTQGIFVTTSDYRKGAKNTADILSQKGYPIKLINAHDFFDALLLTQQNEYDFNNPNEPFAKAILHRVHSQENTYLKGF